MNWLIEKITILKILKLDREAKKKRFSDKSYERLVK